MDNLLRVNVRQSREECPHVNRHSGKGDGFHGVPEIVMLEKWHYQRKRTPRSAKDTLHSDDVVAACSRVSTRERKQGGDGDEGVVFLRRWKHVRC